MSRPQPNEYNPHFAPYTAMATGESVAELIANHSTYLLDFVAGIPEQKATLSYAEGKWTVKEVLQHVIDMERVFAYRALCLARGETQNLPSADQDQFALFHRSKYRAFSDIQEEFLAMRCDHNILFRSFDRTALMQEGLVNGQKSNCQSWVYNSFGHTLYHVKLLKERYGIPD